jgi:hypothetical protein
VPKLTITFDPAVGLRVAAAAGATAGAGPEARVGFDLTADEVPLPKRRPDEADDAYASRVAKVLPDRVQVPIEYFEALAERCGAILEGLADILNHHAGRAALEHALLAEGKAPAGVKQLKLGGKLGGGGSASGKKV